MPESKFDVRLRKESIRALRRHSSLRCMQALFHENFVSFSFFLRDRFSVSFISWSVSFSAPFLGGNIYVNVVLTAVAALPAYPISAALTLR